MGFLTGGGKAAAAQAAAANKIQREQIAKQEAIVEKQEIALSEQQTDLAKRAMASSRARRGGGLRALLSGERQDAELGLPQKTTLGAGV